MVHLNLNTRTPSLSQIYQKAVHEQIRAQPKIQEERIVDKAQEQVQAKAQVQTRFREVEFEEEDNQKQFNILALASRAAERVAETMEATPDVA